MFPEGPVLSVYHPFSKMSNLPKNPSKQEIPIKFDGSDEKRNILARLERAGRQHASF